MGYEILFQLLFDFGRIVAFNTLLCLFIRDEIVLKPFAIEHLVAYLVRPPRLELLGLIDYRCLLSLVVCLSDLLGIWQLIFNHLRRNIAVCKRVNSLERLRSAL